MSRKWVPVIRRKDESLLMVSYIRSAYNKTYHKEILQIPRAIKNFKYIDGWVLYKGNELNSVMEKFEEKLSPEYLEFIISKCKSETSRLLETAQKIKSKGPYQSMSNSKLLYLFSMYSGDTIKVMPFLYGIVILGEVLQKNLEERLKAHVKENNIEENPKQYISSLIFPQENKGCQKAFRGLYRLASQVKSNKKLESIFDLKSKQGLEKIRKDFPKFKRKFENYLKKYDYMEMEFYNGTPLSSKQLFNRIKEVKDEAKERLEQMKRDDKKTKQKFKQACQVLKLTPELKEFVKLIQSVHDQRQYRADALFKAGREVFEFMKEIGDRLGLEDYYSVI